jgi:hypothetical protein
VFFSLKFEVFKFKFLHRLVLQLFLFLFVVNLEFHCKTSLLDVIEDFDEGFSDFNCSDERFDGSECLLIGFGVL